MTDTLLQPVLRPAAADDALCLGVLAMQVFLHDLDRPFNTAANPGIFIYFN